MVTVPCEVLTAFAVCGVVTVLVNFSVFVLVVFAVCVVVTVPCEVLAVCGVVTVPCEVLPVFAVCGVVTIPCEVLAVFAGTLRPWLLLLGACMFLLVLFLLVFVRTL